jgi:hypothetical protein
MAQSDWQEFRTSRDATYLRPDLSFSYPAHYKKTSDPTMFAYEVKPQSFSVLSLTIEDELSENLADLKNFRLCMDPPSIRTSYAKPPVAQLASELGTPGFYQSIRASYVSRLSSSYHSKGVNRRAVSLFRNMKKI